jgi:hypothetical protein
MNREDQKRLPHAKGTPPRPIFSSDVTARQVVHSSSEPPDTSALKEKDLGKARKSFEGSWTLFYKDANFAKYVIGKC